MKFSIVNYFSIVIHVRISVFESHTDNYNDSAFEMPYSSKCVYVKIDV